MVCMGRNLISKNTEGIWTKLEPGESHALPLSTKSKLSESNVDIQRHPVTAYYTKSRKHDHMVWHSSPGLVALPLGFGLWLQYNFQTIKGFKYLYK